MEKPTNNGNRRLTESDAWLVERLADRLAERGVATQPDRLRRLSIRALFAFGIAAPLCVLLLVFGAAMVGAGHGTDIVARFALVVTFATWCLLPITVGLGVASWIRTRRPALWVIPSAIAILVSPVVWLFFMDG